MKKNAKQVSLGIALTEQYVEAALLERCGKQVRLLRGGRLDLPPGVIQAGRVCDVKKLGAAIRQLVRREGIRRKQATICLPDRAVLMQLLELPQNLPSNLHQHIRSEIRHSPLLTGREPVYDFHRLGEGEPDTSRLFVGAVDSERLEEVFQALHAAGLEAAAVEVAMAATLRAMQRNILRRFFDRNLLVADSSAGTLTVCVLVREQLDFIRRTVLPANDDPAQAILDELSAIRQFYEIERELSFDSSWLCVAAGDRPRTDEAQWKELLGQTLGMEVCCDNGAGLMDKPDLKAVQVSACAAGLAMRPFESGKYIAELDFVPARIRRFYELKRLAKGTSAACAAVLLALFLLSVLSGVQIRRLPEAKASEPAAGCVETRRRLETELGVYHREAQGLERLLEAAPQRKWSALLRQIQQRIPQRLWISAIECDETLPMTIRGQALSHQGIYQFADLLEQSDLIETAEVSESRISGESAVLLDYCITCRLAGAQREEVQP